jgi:hypothetical protein
MLKVGLNADEIGKVGGGNFLPCIQCCDPRARLNFRRPPREAQNQLEVLVWSKLAEAAPWQSFFVSSFVSRSVQSHVFSTVLSSLAESSNMLKTGQKREK